MSMMVTEGMIIWRLRLDDLMLGRHKLYPSFRIQACQGEFNRFHMLRKFQCDEVDVTAGSALCFAENTSSVAC